MVLAIVTIAAIYALFGAFADNKGIIVQSEYWSLYGLLFGVILGVVISKMENK